MNRSKPSDDSVISSITGFPWSSEESVAYEAAIEAINSAVGAYSARIAAEEAEPEPDPVVIADRRNRRDECARVRQALDPSDHAEIARVRQHYASLAHQGGRPGVTSPDVARYLLPEAENRRIFAEGIVPEQLSGRTPQATPTVVVLLGQPGAGKTRVAHMLVGTLNKRGGFIDVDSDLYKPYHPQYAQLMRQDDKLMAAYTRADGRRWMDQAHEYVRENGVNAVIQETSQDGEAVAGTMRAYRQCGFRVELLAMGVAEAMSNQGIVHRYHEQVKERGSGRLTVQANADQSYRGMLDLAQLVDEHALADYVAVLRRGEGRPRYDNALSPEGRWQHPPALAAAIETERTRPWAPAEGGDFLRAQEKLHREMGPDWVEHLSRIDHLASRSMSGCP
ncbi:zeta toxin family protein [Streptomyces sp. NPDC046215]|uniref:UDP-N-acetylglucosamine kinase n=1 Tax=Streptomyces stramineus TaxID=173861 RepID=A0ABN0ZEA2_9ACTN